MIKLFMKNKLKTAEEDIILIKLYLQATAVSEDKIVRYRILWINKKKWDEIDYVSTEICRESPR